MPRVVRLRRSGGSRCEHLAAGEVLRDDRAKCGIMRTFHGDILPTYLPGCRWAISGGEFEAAKSE
jgi:hypothetical protein